VNNEMGNITRFKVSRGDLISIEDNYVRTMGRKVRKYFYIEILVNKIVGKFLDHPERMWRRTKTRWFRLLEKKKRVPPLTKILVFATVAFFHARKRLREDKFF
jgi:small subunit ribosomal protein S4